MWCKKFDKVLNAKSQVGYYQFKPTSAQRYDISDEKKLAFAAEQISRRLDETEFPLCKRFEEDFSSAAVQLTDENFFHTYRIRLQFLDAYAGRKHIVKFAQDYIASLSDTMKQDIEKYKRRDRSELWTINPSNLKYIVDNNRLDSK